MSADNEKQSPKAQLSLFDYKLPKAEFSDTPAPQQAKKFEYQSWKLPVEEPTPNRAPRFVSLSAIFHGLALAAAVFLIIPVPQELTVEPITIEIEDLAGPLSLGAPVEATQGGLDAAELPPLEQDLDASLAKVAPVAPSTEKSIPTQRSSAPKAKVQPTATAAKVTPTVDNSDSPELDADTRSALADAPSIADFGDELDSDFAKIEESQNENLLDQKQELADSAEDALKEQNEKLAALEKAEQEKQKILADKKIAADKAKKVAAAAAAKKAEAAAAALAAAEAEKLAEQRQADEAAAKQLAVLNALEAEKPVATAEESSNVMDEAGETPEPEAFATAEANNSEGEMAGPGQGNRGEQKASEQLAGSPQGMRSLDQLKQLNGNPRPQYDRIERRRGDQGEVAFAAYITKDGTPTQFKLLKSTGFRNLDAKTLAALKKWRFYPGQEGWVEMPFRWDLKGGVQQDGGLLRRSAQGF